MGFRLPQSLRSFAMTPNQISLSGAVKLNKAEGERIGERLLAISVQSNHVHVVIAAGGIVLRLAFS